MANGVVTRFLKCLLPQRPTETTADVTNCRQSFQRSLELVEKVDQSIEQKKMVCSRWQYSTTRSRKNLKKTCRSAWAFTPKPTKHHLISSVVNKDWSNLCLHCLSRSKALLTTRVGWMLRKKIVVLALSVCTLK